MGEGDDNLVLAPQRVGPYTAPGAWPYGRLPVDARPRRGQDVGGLADAVGALHGDGVRAELLGVLRRVWPHHQRHAAAAGRPAVAGAPRPGPPAGRGAPLSAHI